MSMIGTGESARKLVASAGPPSPPPATSTALSTRGERSSSITRKRQFW